MLEWKTRQTLCSECDAGASRFCHSNCTMVLKLSGLNMQHESHMLRVQRGWRTAKIGQIAIMCCWSGVVNVFSTHAPRGFHYIKNANLTLSQSYGNEHGYQKDVCLVPRKRLTAESPLECRFENGYSSNNGFPTSLSGFSFIHWHSSQYIARLSCQQKFVGESLH